MNQQRSAKSTSAEVLHFEGHTLTTTEGVANAFSGRFENLATLVDHYVVDKEYSNQVAFDKLLIESLAPEQNGTVKTVTAKEVLNIFDLLS